MQLTADPRGTGFLNKSGTVKKEILGGRTRYAKHINLNFPVMRSPCALSITRYLLQQLWLGFDPVPNKCLYEVFEF